MTPEDFARLPRKEKFAELRRLGIVHGQANSDEELLGYYREWFSRSEAFSDEVVTEKVEPDPERRINDRAQINVEIGLRTETNFFVGFSGDISEGGLFLTTVSLLPIGTPVTLSFTFPGGIEIEAEGRVAWTREGVTFDSELNAGMGIRFTRLSDEALSAIQEFTSVREPIFHAD
jgi:uncharacterized protein (TIGR02266 family)